MFTKVEPLTKDQHQDLRFSSTTDYKFADRISSAPVALSEFAQAGKYYPIVFLKETSLPLALLSFEKDKNSFVLENGSWKVPYIPAHFRRYPFIFAKADEAAQPDSAGQTDSSKTDSSKTDSSKTDSSKTDSSQTDDNNGLKAGEEKFIVCIDRDAPHFAAEQGNLMFTANGEFTDLTLKAVEFLKGYQQELARALSFVKLLEENDVLVERQFNVNRNGQSTPLGGFRVVDMEKVAALDDALLADWVRRGIMSMITSHLNSLIGISL